jgi:acylpyruvate hydrolase
VQLAAFRARGEIGLATHRNGCLYGLLASDRRYPGSLEDLIAKGPAALSHADSIVAKGEVFDLDQIEFLPPLRRPSKIICVGLNYREHSKESGFAQPDYPTLFARFPSSLIGHGAPIVAPALSDSLDFEGELAAIIGTGGRFIPKASALDHVVGYSVFNDGSIREYQFKTPQWTMGKNFDDTGAFGPAFVSADELPPGGRGLRLETRLNGKVVQSANTDDLVFDVATLVSTISEAITLEPGDVIVTGTPSGVGHSRSPRLYMHPGDVCEVEIESVGLLRNAIVGKPTRAAANAA